MRTLLRSCVALSLLALVATATAGANAKSTFQISLDGVTFINLTAAGPNGQMKGTGHMKIGKAATYPMTVASGSYTTTSSNSNNNGGSNSSVTGTVTLKGTIKKQGVSLPFVLVGTSGKSASNNNSGAGTSKLTVNVTTKTTSGGTTTTTTTKVDTDWRGTVTLTF